MKINPDANDLSSNVVSFKKFKDKKPDMVSSTIACRRRHGQCAP
jgi:hypothetical protein